MPLGLPRNSFDRPFPDPEPPLSDAILARLREALQERYLVERELGEGGAATVYLARDLRHERPVAIKVLRPDLAESLGAERFTREIRTAANLQHPHILTVHDSGSTGGLLYYVMPFVEGESLRARIQREGALPLSDVVRILREVADALAFAHAHGVVHRDIKPDNVLLSGKHALVADFGVAKAISEATGRRHVTTLGVALGTPAYMAPEQAAADPGLDHRVDLYALGATAFEMLTGEPPYARRTPQQVIAAHLSEPAPPVLERRPSTPPALAALVAKCLEKQPADRWQSADEVVAALEGLATPTGMAPTGAVSGATAPARMTARWPLVVLAVGAVVLALAIWKLWPRGAGGVAPLDANVVAVLPFQLNATPDLAYLREGIVDVLESSLTGEGGPRAVASLTTIARWKRAGGAEHGLTEEEARGIARDLGAGQLLRGSIVGTAQNLILSATLVPSSGSRREVKASVQGPADSIASLGASLALQLLSLWAGEAPERLASLAAVPPEALRAYLEGRSLLRAGAYDDATKAFGRALAIDSTFALAAFGHAVASSWSLSSFGTSPGAEVAFRHKDRLGPRDQILLRMWSPSRFTDSVLTLRQVMAVRERLVQQIPDRPEAWYLIGDQYFHTGRAMGLSVEESRSRAENAFRRALDLDPGNVYIKQHLADMPLFSPDGRDRIPALEDSLQLTTPMHRLLGAIIRGDSAAVRTIMARFHELDAGALLMSGFYASILGAPAVADSATRVALDRPGGLAERGNALRFARSGAWAQGRPSAAARLSQRMQELNSGAGIDEDALGAAIFANGDTVAAARAASALRGVLARPTTGAQRRNAAFAVGLWDSFRGDADGVRSAVRTLDSLAAYPDETVDPGLSRLRADALRLTAPNATPDLALVERVDSVLGQGPAVGGDARAAMNLIVARSFERLGDAARGARAAQRVSPGEVLFIMTGPGLRDQGRLLLAAGDTAGALRAWQLYLTPRGSAEPAQRAADDAIRRKVEELQRVRR